MEIISYTSGLLSSHTYVLAEDGHALVIDPAQGEIIWKELCERQLILDKILLTHEHCDHCAGAEFIRDRSACKILVSKVCAERLMSDSKNYSRYFDALATIQTKLNQAENIHMDPFVLPVDETFEEYNSFVWQGHHILLKETPGHSPGSICILVDGRFLFSGDTLLWKEKTITRFLDGSKELLLRRTVPWLREIPANITVYPGHLEIFCLGERLKEHVI